MNLAFAYICNISVILTSFVAVMVFQKSTLNSLIISTKKERMVT